MFGDRTEAGGQLARALSGYHRHDPLVLGLPRGGLPVALPVAQALNAELDVLVVRKLGVPGNPEYAMGAVGEDGVVVMDHAARRRLHITEDSVRTVAAREQAEVERRVAVYRAGSHRIGLAGRNVIIVDDGLATGSTAAAAVRVARHLGARHVTVAVPVGSREAVDWLTDLADDVVCLDMPDPFWAVGEHYRDFSQVDDEHVMAALRARPRGDPRARDRAAPTNAEVTIEAAGVPLSGHLAIPAEPVGVVVFIHGTGSDRHSPRNSAVASAFRAAGVATLLFDLLTPVERAAGTELPITHAANRVIAVMRWLKARADTQDLPLGLYGSSSGAAVALVAAAEEPQEVRGVVSRGGRPDLAGAWLDSVQAPTLLIVGALDYAVLDLNSDAQRRLRCENHLQVVRGASHLFEERGTLQQAAASARAWFLRCFQAEPRALGFDRAS